MVYRFSLLAFLAALYLSISPALADLVVGGDPRVDTGDFRITTFATGLNYPVGMVALDDGSLLVAVSKGTRFFSSTAGQVLRLADVDGDGVADEQQVLFDEVPGGGLTALRRAGDLFFATGQGSGKPISIFRAGATPADPLTLVGSLQIGYSGNWLHPHSALSVRPAPGRANSYDLVFQLGSDRNLAKTTRTLPLTSTIGVEGSLKGDALYMVTITDHGDSVSGADLRQLATGLRNAAGHAFHPLSGDLYLQDNGIDGLEDVNESHSADEIDVIPRDAIGGPVVDFGFPDHYIRYRTGEFVGGGGIAPLFAFHPLPDPLTGDESEGAADIAFAPPGFPPGLNDGLFVGFHGKFSLGGVANEENPLVYVDLRNGTYFHFVGVDRPEVGHLDGLLATERDLFVADISPSGGFGGGTANTGVIYQIHSLRDPATAVAEETAALPLAFHLAAPRPNPFNPETVLEFSIPDLGGAAAVALRVYSATGQRVATLVDAELGAGTHAVRWDGRDEGGAAVASGVYLYRLEVGGRFAASRRMVLLK